MDIIGSLAPPREWKAGDRAMVEIAWVSEDGEFCTLKDNIGHTVVQTAALHPLPPALTPEDAAVIEAAESMFQYWERSGWNGGNLSDEAQTLIDELNDRRAARQSPPVPADSAGKPESAAQADITPSKVTELLYPLPDGSAVLLSDVRRINIERAKEETIVWLTLRDEKYHGARFGNLDAAAAFADTIRDLVNAARSGQPYTRDTSAPTEKAPQLGAPAFKVGDRVRDKINNQLGTVGDTLHPRPFVRFDNGNAIWMTPSELELASSPDLSALRDAVVEAAKACSAAHWPDGQCPSYCPDEDRRLFEAVRALLAAEAPRDPVEELREAAEEIIRLENQAVQCGADVAGPVRNALDRLRAALAAMKERG